jgi:hypothetical protein
MRDYAWKVINYAFRGFAVRADLLYALASVGVAGATGSRDKPLGTLTPWEISWYVIVFMASYLAIRLFLVAPYRLWQDQRSEIAALILELGRPERIGADELHRLRAQKRLELASDVQTLSWLYYKPRDGGDAVLADCHDRIIRLIGEVNPGAEFKDAFNTYNQEASKMLEDNCDANRIMARVRPLSEALVNFLHGAISTEELHRVHEEANG